MIPRIFHQVWLGPDPFPEEFARYQASWTKLNPGWELRFWTEDDIPNDLRRPEIRERLRVPAERSDMLRIVVLYRYGGVYIDTDFECRKPIEPLIRDVDFFTAYLKPQRVNNAIIGSVPAHEILDRMLREMRPREFHGYDKYAAGPLLFNSIIFDYEIKIFDPELFYPSTPDERERAVAIHHAARSWKDAEGFRQATLKAEERLARAQAQLEKERRQHDHTRQKLETLRTQKRLGGTGRLAFHRLRTILGSVRGR